MRLKQLVLPMLVASALSACAIGPDYKRLNMDMPQAAANVPAISSDWWREFGDPVLTGMVDEALRYNRDLLQAAARVEEAAAAAGVARSSLLPQVNANVGTSRVQTSRYSSGAGVLADSQQAGLSASWELDLWGKLRREREAALADVSASKGVRDALRLSLGSQVAQTYFQLACYDAQLNSARATLDSREQALTLRKKRFNGGMTSELELRQAEAETAAARAIVPQLTQAVTQTEHALAVLLGRSPRDIAANLGRGQGLAAIRTPVDIPAGLPSDLLLRRPDIAAAEARLIAANARIGVARAAYFPSISLSAGIGSASTELAQLFSGPAQTWNFAANLAAPIFNAGKIAAGVDAANARQKQALAAYEKTVQQAFAETLDVMSAVATTRDTEAAQQAQLASLREALRLARLRYDNGYSSYLEVLDAERGVFQVEQALSSARLARLSAIAALYTALGGGVSVLS